MDKLLSLFLFAAMDDHDKMDPRPLHRTQLGRRFDDQVREISVKDVMAQQAYDKAALTSNLR